MRTEIESQLREFLIENLVFSDDASLLRDDESLLDQGAIDSTGIMELVEFVCSRFNLEVPVKDINQQNFDSINRLANYIRSRQTQSPPKSEAPVIEAIQPA